MHHAADHRDLFVDSLHFEPPHRTRGFDIGGFVSDVGGVFKGIGEGAVDTVAGLAEAVTHPVETVEGVVSLVTNPTESWPALWHGITDPIVQDWQAGNEGEAIGRGIFGVVEAVFGAKGLTKLGKLGKAGRLDPPDAPRPRPDVDTPKPDAERPRPDTDGAPVVDARTGEALTALEDAGVKFTKGDVVWADRLPPESIIQAKAGVAFLERGNPKAGLQHILHGNPDVPGSTGHADDFARRGVSQEQVPALIRDAITKGDVKPGPKSGSYDVTIRFNGAEQRLRLAIGNNGFIVSAYPI